MNYKGDYVKAMRENAGYLSDCIAETNDINLLHVICFLCGSAEQEACNSCRMRKKIDHYINAYYGEG